MTEVARASAVVLAVVFAWAGVTKLRTPQATATSFAGLRLAAPAMLARLVPVVELAVAAGLVAAPSLAAWAALALLLAFSVVIARALAAGATVPCACFGGGAVAAADGEDARPLSTLELVRNAGLGALAIVASGAGSGWVRWPALPAVVIVTVLVALTRVAFAVVDLRRLGGHVLSTPLAGEARR
jgi:hypothetical protein